MENYSDLITEKEERQDLHKFLFGFAQGNGIDKANELTE